MRAGLMLGLGLWVVLWMSACSFAVEVGYHGTTGRDNRTQTQLVRQVKAEKERY